MGVVMAFCSKPEFGNVVRMARMARIACIAALVAASCGQPTPMPEGDTAASTGSGSPPGREMRVTQSGAGCDTAAARRVVEGFGDELKRVPLLAPESTVRSAIREVYSPYVTPELLERWLASPASAPGRESSSPWPERIQIDTVLAEGAGTCRIEGQIIYLTSVETTQGGAAALRAVTLLARQVEGDGWRISSYEEATETTPAPPPTGSEETTSSAAAAAVIRTYYAAINARDYRRAYELWGDGGRASGQSYEEFAAGFAETASVEVEIGTPGRVEGAAGSRFVEVPVVIRATLRDGERQTFTGHYTLRRVVVDGAPPAARRWHIYSAEIVRAPHPSS